MPLVLRDESGRAALDVLESALEPLSAIKSPCASTQPIAGADNVPRDLKPNVVPDTIVHFVERVLVQLLRLLREELECVLGEMSCQVIATALPSPRGPLASGSENDGFFILRGPKLGRGNCRSVRHVMVANRASECRWGSMRASEASAICTGGQGSSSPSRVGGALYGLKGWPEGGSRRYQRCVDSERFVTEAKSNLVALLAGSHTAGTYSTGCTGSCQAKRVASLARDKGILVA